MVSSTQELMPANWEIFLVSFLLHLSVSPVDPVYQICLESFHWSAHPLYTSPDPARSHRLILSQQLLTPLLFLPLRISPHIQSGLYIVKSNPPLLWSLVVASHTLSSLTLTPLDEATLSLPQGAGTRSSFCLKCPSALSFT